MSSKTKYCRRGMSSQFGSPLRILTICLFFLVSLVHGIMDDNTRSILLSLHNGVRHMVLIGKIKGQPKAVSMEQLKWNVELERKAKVLSSQCRDGHDTPEDRKIPGFSYVGQNRAGADTVESGFQAWLNEHLHYDFFTQQCYAPQCGHYTQLVWETTTDIGCYATECPDYHHRLSVVCNYAPGGNYVGRQPYKVAKQ